MIISTANLNNIENKITTPQIAGVEFIICTNVNNSMKLNASYNYIINILEAGKLPVIKYNNMYIFISALHEGEEFYALSTTNGPSFIANNMSTNLIYQLAQ